jgi:hypothetical protein
MWTHVRQGWAPRSLLGQGNSDRSRDRTGLGARVGAVLVLALAASAAWCAGAQATIGFGAFAGYQRYGPVRTMHADWVVPRVTSAGPFALASTWVGAQAPRPGRAFIQVGTSEGCAEGPCGPEGPEYYTFWSDSTHGYHPQRLFDVGPGDHISARLMLVRGNWRVAVADETRRVRARVTTTDETGDVLELAEWTQEDPVLAPAVLAPYPTLEGVRLTDVEVNGLRPSYNRLYSTWMSAGGITLAPTPLEGGSFALVPAPPLGAVATTFLIASAQADEERYAFDDALSRWSGATAPAEIVAGAERYVAALVSERQQLAAELLPPATLAQRRELLEALRALTLRVGAIGHTRGLALTSWRRSVLLAEGRVSVATHLIRRELALPEVVAPGLVLGSVG